MNSKKMLLYLMTFLIIFSSVIHPSVLIAETVDDDSDIEAGSLDFSVQTVEEEPEEETGNTPEVLTGEQSGNDDSTAEEDGGSEEIVTPDLPDEVMEPPVTEDPAVEEPVAEEPITEDSAEEELSTDEEEPETDMGMGVLNVTGGPGAYTPDSGSLSLNVTLDGQSTNTHTRPVRLWTQGGVVHLAVKSTHEIQFMTVRGASMNLLHRYGPGTHISIDGQSYNPADGLQGNTKDAHFTIYTISREAVGDINDPNFSFFIKGIGGGHDVGGVFTVTIPTVSATVNKTWVDGPMTPVNVDLLRSNTVFQTILLTANSEGKASHYWPSLNYTDATGVLYDYTIRESDPGEGYTVEFQSSYDAGTLSYTFTLTNRYTSPVQDINVQKVWNDENNNDGIRPNNVTIQLLKNGAFYDSVTMTADSGWSHVFTNLPQTASDGSFYTYSVAEADVPDGYISTVTSSGNDFTVTNSYDIKRIEVSGTKTWVDSDNQDGIRPETITVNLLEDDVIVQSADVSADTDWSYTFSGLPKYVNGSEIVYSVMEDLVPESYTVKIDGFNLINEYQPKTTEITVKKYWYDGDNQDGKRPDSIEVNLLADDEVTQTVTLNKDDSWSHVFKDLPVNKQGQAITYTVEEATVVDGYTSVVDGFKIKNSYTPEKINIEGTKSWNDGNNQDGKRPEDITVHLMVGDDIIDTLTVKAEDEWEYKFTNLPKYKGGEAIDYRVLEVAVDDYSTTYDGFNITNSYTPKETSVSVAKVWDDQNNQDGNRPAVVSFQLHADGNPVGDPVEISNDNEWRYTWTELPEFNGGQPVVYTVEELSDEDNVYEVTVSKVDKNQFVVTNSYTPETMEIPVTKFWDDDENRDGKRPNSINVSLLADGEVTETATLKKSYDWIHVFEDLPVNNQGQAITYTIVEETVIDGYSSEVDGFEITNSYTPETMEIPVTKIWDDADNQDGLRPTEITVNLLANGDVMRTARLDVDKNWSHLFEGLPVNQDGDAINYTIEEASVPEGYSSVVDGFEITNSHTPETTSIPVTKFWNDMDNNDGMRPVSVDVQLLADDAEDQTATLTADDDWSHTFTGLPVYRDGGIEIQYSIEELNVPDGYTSVVDGFEITNSHTPDTLNIPVKKFWEDMDNNDGLRPASVDVRLFADDVEIDSETIRADDNWSYTFRDLPVYRDGGIEIQYSIEELNVPDGYTSDIDGFEIFNTHVPERIDIEGTKSWDDGDNQDGNRPNAITVHLMAGDEILETVTVTEEDSWEYAFTNLLRFHNGSELDYRVVEVVPDDYTATYNGHDITNSYTPDATGVTVLKAWDDNDDQDGHRAEFVLFQLKADGMPVGDSVEVSEDNNWRHTWTELPVFNRGQPIVYTVEEVSDTDNMYEKNITEVEENQFVVTNSYTPEIMNIPVNKAWDDMDNNDGVRPATVEVHLFADDEEISSATLTAEDGWSHTFRHLPVYRDGGSVIEYTVQELVVPDGYTSAVDEFEITNSYIPERIDIEGTKSWNDGNNQDGNRPDEITIHLMSGQEILDTVTVTEEDDWEYAFTNLLKFNNGTEVQYRVVEIVPDDYTTTYDGYDIFNSYTPEETGVTASKFWEDMDNQDGIRPDSVFFQLYGDGNLIGESVEISEENDWRHTWTELPVFHDGQPIVYTIEEISDTEYGYDVSITEVEENQFVVTNSHTPETMDIPVTKFWDDMDNNDGVRPPSIKVQLFGDNVELLTATLTTDDDWSHTFTGLPVYRDGGIEIQYSIEEMNVPDGYTSDVDGFEIFNTHVPERIDIEGTKSWDDGNNQDGNRPDAVTVHLMAGDEIVDSAEVTADDDWSYAFTNLYKFNDGQEIKYQVVEEVPDDYTATYDGFNITNSYTPEETGVTASKRWSDNDNQDGNRPEHVVFQLYADDEPLGDPVKLRLASEWRYTWTGLPVFKDGEEIVYTVEELLADEDIYDDSVTEVQDNFFIITNSNSSETRDIPVTKVWNDMNNNDGARPLAVDVQLFADDVLIKTATLNADDDWTYTFEDLYVNRDGGIPIEYRIEEANVPEGYTSIVDGFEITNSYVPERIDIEGTKFWDDSSNQDGNRPDEITVHLMAGEEIIDTAEVTEGDDWTYMFTDLLRFGDGLELQYHVVEEVPDGYTATYDGFNITNSYTPEETGVTASKHWSDNDNQDGNRPDFVVFQLYAGDEPVGDTVKLNLDIEWRYTWTGLPVFKDGTEIVYTVEELIADEDIYDDTVTEVRENHFIITNSNSSEAMDILVTKIWDDADNQDGIRSNAITVNLLADNQLVRTATLTADDNWTYTFEDLYVNRDGGIPIDYTIEEAGVPEGYTSVIDGFEITNSYTPQQTSVTGSKQWDDGDNQDGHRPRSVFLQLRANGEIAGTPIEVSDDNDWSHTWTGLSVFSNGTPVVYTVEELLPGDSVYEVTVTEVEDNQFRITNSHTPETMGLGVSKIWDDMDNNDGVRPISIDVQLFANEVEVSTATLTADMGWTYEFMDLPVYSSGEEIIYTVAEIIVPDGYTTEVDGFEITNSYVSERITIAGIKSWDDGNNQDGNRPDAITIHLMVGDEVIDTVTVTAEDDWEYGFENLLRFDNGIELEYHIVEVVPEDYSVTYDGFDLINSYTPEQTSVTASKYWNDGDNQDGHRPQSVYLQLRADGQIAGTPIEVSDDNDWTHTWTGLSVFSNGTPVIYTVEELLPTDSVYEVTVTEVEDNQFVITNSHTPETIDIPVTKVWDDADNQDGNRPEAVQVQLVADGNAVSEAVHLSTVNDWAHIFAGLPVYNDGTAIVYTVEEVVDEDVYDVAIAQTDDGFVITNSYTPETVDVAGTKTWDDGNNQDGNRPDAITVNLMVEDEIVDTLNVTAADEWTYAFNGLPRYDDGIEIDYRVVEIGIDDYTTTYNGYDITNSYTPGEAGKTVVKVWDDGEDQDGNRPGAVQVQLFADGSPTGDPVELNEAMDWRHSWTGLPVMDNGTEIVYTVEELNNDVYDVTITELNKEFIVINSYTPETVEIAGVKTWDDNDNEDNMRPASISVHLHANGEVIDTVMVTEDANWTYMFTDLPVYQDGEAITYTISESSIDHYVATYDGYDITNTYVRDHTGVTVTKVWKDYLNKYNTRAPYIEIQLIQNDLRYGDPVRLSPENDWEYGFTNLPMYVDGEPAVYRVIELTEIEGYKYEIYGGYLGYFTMVNILTDKPAEPETPPTPTVPVVDEPEELPKTGIANENVLFALLTVLLGIAGMTLLFRRRKIDM